MNNIKDFGDFINENKKMKYNEKGKCPVCGSKKLKYKGGDMTDNTDEFNYKCKKCRFKGTEIHEFNPIDIPKFSYHVKRKKNKNDGNDDFPDVY